MMYRCSQRHPHTPHPSHSMPVPAASRPLVTVPYGIRVSKIYEAGGELVYGFGYFDVLSPSGRAVQVDPIRPTLNSPGIKLLKLKYDKPLSIFGFEFNLRRYTAGTTCGPPWRRAATPSRQGCGWVIHGHATGVPVR